MTAPLFATSFSKGQLYFLEKTSCSLLSIRSWVSIYVGAYRTSWSACTIFQAATKKYLFRILYRTMQLCFFLWGSMKKTSTPTFTKSVLTQLFLCIGIVCCSLCQPRAWCSGLRLGRLHGHDDRLRQERVPLPQIHAGRQVRLHYKYLVSQWYSLCKYSRRQWPP